MIQLILLSGGSGKRLWPLSNETRSKQFLPLLDAPDETKESMLQRVVRQAKESGLDCEITVVTNFSQKDIIINQLGNGVGIVTEPQRRNTFPAIALSAAYLSLVRKCPKEDVVVVMPCDPYTELGYFKTIGKIAELARKGVADLVLMGIKPSYPSEKYGYIVPGIRHEGYMSVRRFTEKPDYVSAGKLLSEGAYWNGGVFGFKLGYMTDLVGKYLKADEIESFILNYGRLPKISFDYEVVEKASSVAVVEFDGEWKDLGTWNSLCEVLPGEISGNARLGDKTRNVHVINELPTPIFCNGIEDAVIAACPDGILVSSKESSEGIKPYVEDLSERPMYEERRWGKYTVIGRSSYNDGYKSLIKELTIYPGRYISYQVHAHRDEIWTFVDGVGRLVLDGVERRVSRGDVVHIAKGQYHAIRAVSQLQIIEVQTGDLLEETDIVRTSWDWGD